MSAQCNMKVKTRLRSRSGKSDTASTWPQSVTDSTDSTIVQIAQIAQIAVSRSIAVIWKSGINALNRQKLGAVRIDPARPSIPRVTAVSQYYGLILNVRQRPCHLPLPRQKTVPVLLRQLLS